MADERYNIMVRTERSTLTRLGLSLAELDAKVLSYYRQGKAFLLEGALVAPDRIEQIAITATTETPDALLKKAEAFRKSRRYAWLVTPDVAAATRFGRDVTDEILGGPPGQLPEGIVESRQADDSVVFVVHGRDGGARAAMFAFLRSLGLKPLEWTTLVASMPNPAPFIGDVLDEGFRRAKAVVVLFTPDDVARLRDELIGDDEENERACRGQARPNVLFEAGMAFGRRPRQTVLVELGTLRPFSDIAGRHVVRLDDSVAARQDLALRLKTAGCAVDMSGTDWHTAGDFEEARLT
jgi:predicted nucleotide-binding protein